MKPTANLSLDLDNKWSYLKTHGDPQWSEFPTYLDVVVPRVLDFLAERDLKITFFVVGQDAVLPENAEPLKQLADAGHEIGNHSFHHEPWLHRYSDRAIAAEIAKAEEAIAEVTGVVPRGFRGPGFSISQATLEVLCRRGYQYDASTFPTFLGPLARAYYFMTARLDDSEKENRNALFGHFSDGFRPLRPYRWQLEPGELMELPVTTLPVFKVPIHVSYLLYLGTFSPWLARTYFRMAVTMCRMWRTPLSLLLHPLDFLGCDDTTGLEFFPAMNVPAERKLKLVGEVFDMLERSFRLVPMGEHVAELAQRKLPIRTPAFAALPGLADPCDLADANPSHRELATNSLVTSTSTSNHDA